MLHHYGHRKDYVTIFAFRTILKQESVININGIPMASYFEDVVKNTMAANANKVMMVNNYSY